MIEQLEWLDIEDAAVWLGVPTAVVEEAIARGQLPVLRLGDLVRISKSAVFALVSPTADPVVREPVTGAGAPDQGEHLPMPAEMEWLSELTKAELTSHEWPRVPGRPPNITYFDESWSARIRLQGEPHLVTLGADYARSRKQSANAPDRLFSFIDNMRPIAEFLEIGGDHQAWASLIKVGDNKSLVSVEQLPPLYQQARVAAYADVTGRRERGRPNGLAVIIARDDLSSCVHHAAARELARSAAEQVRRYAFREYIHPARERGERQVVIRAGDIHAGLGLKNRYPLVCAALGSEKFRRQYGVTAVHTTGGNQGANVLFTFGI